MCQLYVVTSTMFYFTASIHLCMIISTHNFQPRKISHWILITFLLRVFVVFTVCYSNLTHFVPRISFSARCLSIIHPYNNDWILNCDITNDMTSSRLQSILVLQPWIFQSPWNKDHRFITCKLFSKLSLLFNSTIILPEPCIFLYQRQRSTMTTQTKWFNKKNPNRHLWSKFYKYESAFLQALLY